MVSLAWRQERIGDATLVALQLSTDGPRRIKVENLIDGPVRPPRRNGRPAAGWHETGYEGVVHGGTTALGYAAPGDPVDPPARIAAADPAPDAAATDTPPESPAGVLRALGDPLVPRDAVPNRSTKPNERPSEQRDAHRPERPADRRRDRPVGASVDGHEDGPTVDDGCGPQWTETGSSGCTGVPPVIRSWFDDVERSVTGAGASESPRLDVGREQLLGISRRAAELARRAGDRPTDHAATGGDRE